MNLKTLFQSKYFYQNLKKSKAILAIFLFLFPLILALSHSMSTTQGVISFFQNNFLGDLIMFLYPITLSVLLFSFVFQKRKVDFMMSMPLSRKQIFITNTLTGISVILASFLIYVCFLFLFALLFHQVISFPYLITYLLYSLLGYILVFTVANLAISLAGNFLTTLVLIALLFLFVPVNSYIYRNFVADYGRMVELKAPNIEVKNYNNCTDYLEIKNCEEQKKSGIYYTDLEKNIVTTHSIPVQNITNLRRFTKIIPEGIYLKTFFLIFIMFFLGCFAFQKRKMENCETSFQSFHLHSFVKILTIIPLFFFLFALKISFENIFLSLLIILTYFFLYDLITRKKITHVLLSLVYFTLTFFICLGCFQTLKYHLEKQLLPKSNHLLESIEIKDIQGFQLDIPSSSEFNLLRGYDISKITFQDRELIQTFLSYAFAIPSNYISNYKATYYKLYLKDGTFYRGIIYLNNDEFSEFKEQLKESRELNDYLKVKNNQILTVSNLGQNYRVNELNITFDSLKKVLKQKDYEEANDFDESFIITLYHNNTLEEIFVPYEEAPIISNALIKKNNQHLIKLLETNEIQSITTQENATLRNTKSDRKNFEKMVSYIKTNHYNIDTSQKYIRLYVTLENEEMYYYYTNDLTLLKNFPEVEEE